MDRERFFHILDFLRRRTDEQSFVTLKDIRDYLMASCGFETVSLATLRRDIEGMRAAGCEIEEKTGEHNTRYYRICNSAFSFDEIRFLVDSVCVNKFLSTPQKQKLIHKFEGLCSQREIRKLISRIHTSEVAPPSLNLLENLERIHDIISQSRKIHFFYGTYNAKKEIAYRKNRRDLTPCRVDYLTERFYLICIDNGSGQRRSPHRPHAQYHPGREGRKETRSAAHAGGCFGHLSTTVL